MTIEKSSVFAGDFEIRLADKEDASEISRLLQELLTFYGMPLKYQRSFMSHVIENEVFQEKTLYIEKRRRTSTYCFSAYRIGGIAHGMTPDEMLPSS